MNKWQAIQSFWESFSIPAYVRGSVPKDATLPYITYTAVTGAFESPVPISGSVWYRSTSWREIDLKTKDIASQAHKIIPLDDGYLFIVQGKPFSTQVPDPDETIKRMDINLMAEFYTNY